MILDDYIIFGKLCILWTRSLQFLYKMLTLTFLKVIAAIKILINQSAIMLVRPGGLGIAYWT